MFNYAEIVRERSEMNSGVGGLSFVVFELLYRVLVLIFLSRKNLV